VALLFSAPGLITIWRQLRDNPATGANSYAGLETCAVVA